MTVALLNEIPEESRLWLVTEWAGCLVADRALLAELGDELEHWRVDQEVERHGLVVLRPLPISTTVIVRRVEGPDAYRESIRSAQPIVCRVSIEDLLEDEARWFGELASRRGGGSMALIALSAEGRTSGWITLRNPVAMGLRILDEPDLLGVRVQNGELRIHGWGATRGDRFDKTFAEWREACRGMSELHLRRAVEAAAVGQFLILLAVEASLDPEVRIPTGTVVEQTSLSGAQTLAVARTLRLSVAAGPVTPIVLPAWCLNRELRPPSGEEVRPTRLVLEAAEGADQESVWEAVRSRRAATT